MVRIAVTGGIACGKSRVASYLETIGIPVCDADRVAHRAIAPEQSAYSDVLAAFGGTILGEDGQIDRQVLADIVFADADALSRLNRIIHPIVHDEIQRWLLEQQHAAQPLAAVVIPLLFEANMATGWDAIICVGCSPEIQHERLLARGLNDEECRRRVAVQMPLEQKMARSDHRIWNDGTFEELELRIEAVMKLIQEEL